VINRSSTHPQTTDPSRGRWLFLEHAGNKIRLFGWDTTKIPDQSGPLAGGQFARGLRENSEVTNFLELWSGVNVRLCPRFAFRRLCQQEGKTHVHSPRSVPQPECFAKNRSDGFVGVCTRVLRYRRNYGSHGVSTLESQHAPSHKEMKGGGLPCCWRHRRLVTSALEDWSAPNSRLSSANGQPRRPMLLGLIGRN
jgi:hypothetical protein